MAKTYPNLAKLVHAHLEAREEREAQDKYIYASEIGYCSRRIVMGHLGYPKDKSMSAKGYRATDNGDMFHENMQQYFIDMGLCVLNELPLREVQPTEEEYDATFLKRALDLAIYPRAIEKCDELKIHARLDSIVDIPGFGVCIVELKSINDGGFNYLKGKPKPEHLDQLMLYMLITGIHTGVVYYENKNSHEPMEFWFEYDEVRARRIVEKIKKILRHLDDKTRPEREYDARSFECTYCDFRSQCYEEIKPVGIGLDQLLGEISSD